MVRFGYGKLMNLFIRVEMTSKLYVKNNQIITQIEMIVFDLRSIRTSVRLELVGECLGHSASIRV